MKEMGEFTYFKKERKNEAVYQSQDIAKPFGKSSWEVNVVIFPCFIIELSSFAWNVHIK